MDVSPVTWISLAAILGLEAILKVRVEIPKSNLSKLYTPKFMYAKGEYDTKNIVAARVLTVQLATILDLAAISEIGVETPKYNLSKLLNPKSCMSGSEIKAARPPEAE